MSYEVVLSDKAEADLNGLPLHTQAFVEARLEALSRAPATLSRRSVSPPYPPGCQLYEFDQSIPGEARHHFAVLFRYGQDETTLQIVAIGHRVL